MQLQEHARQPVVRQQAVVGRQVLAAQRVVPELAGQALERGDGVSIERQGLRESAALLVRAREAEGDTPAQLGHGEPAGNRHRPLVERLRGVVVAHHAQQGREVVEAPDHLDVIGRPRRLADLERALVELARLEVAAARAIEQSERAERARDRQTVGTERPLADQDGALVDETRLVPFARLLQHATQLDQAARDLGVIGTEGALANRERALDGRAGGRVVTHLAQERAQAVEQARQPGLSGPSARSEIWIARS